jgi:hypothetical protein
VVLVPFAIVSIIGLFNLAIPECISPPGSPGEDFSAADGRERGFSYARNLRRTPFAQTKFMRRLIDG